MPGVYLHIPFCRTLCPYCDFVRERISGDAPAAYIDALCKEIQAFPKDMTTETLFFGGGTPSLLAPDDLVRILDTLSDRFHFAQPEITLEVNPDDVRPDRVRAWAAAGINRISLGVQSYDDAVLRYLGRRHGSAVARQACAQVADTFENWSMDLIYGAPPVAVWSATLEECLRFAPPHISVYGLTYEAGTPFEKRMAEAIPDDDALELYRMAEDALAEYRHYEISNYARHGFEARHNLVYWRNEEYAGFGTGAYSYLDGVRARNHSTTAAYCADPGGKSEALRLLPEEIQTETLIQHFRLQEGIDKKEFVRRFGVPPETRFGPAIEALKARGLIEEKADRLRPTRQGFYLNNEIGLALVDIP